MSRAPTHRVFETQRHTRKGPTTLCQTRQRMRCSRNAFACTNPWGEPFGFRPEWAGQGVCRFCQLLAPILLTSAARASTSFAASSPPHTCISGQLSPKRACMAATRSTAVSVGRNTHGETASSSRTLSASQASTRASGAFIPARAQKQRRLWTTKTQSTDEDTLHPLPFLDRIRRGPRE